MNPAGELPAQHCTLGGTQVSPKSAQEMLSLNLSFIVVSQQWEIFVGIILHQPQAPTHILIPMPFQSSCGYCGKCKISRYLLLHMNHLTLTSLKQLEHSFGSRIHALHRADATSLFVLHVALAECPHIDG